MLSVAKLNLEIRHQYDPDRRFSRGQNEPEIPAPCGGCADSGLRARGHNKRKLGHDDLQTPANHRPRRDARLSRAAAARHRRFPAQHRPALCRPREVDSLARSVVSYFESYVKLNKKISAEVVGVVQSITDFGKLGDTVASHLAVKIADRQGILETLSVTQRLEKVLGLMESEISVLQVE